MYQRIYGYVEQVVSITKLMERCLRRGRDQDDFRLLLLRHGLLFLFHDPFRALPDQKIGRHESRENREDRETHEYRETNFQSQ